MRHAVEVRRQLFHIAAGLFFAILVVAVPNAGLVLLALAAAGAALAAIASGRRVLFVTRMLELFDRPGANGRGAIFLALGCALSAIVFPKAIALGSIMVLTLGDSVSHLVGRFYGRTRLLSATKLLEGTLAGIAAGAIAASFFVPAPLAIAGAAVAMVVEAVEIRLFGVTVDDNIYIPLIAGAVMLLAQMA